MNVLSAVLLVVFAVIGAAAVVREISLRIFSYKGESSVLIITPIDNNDDVEFVLRSAASRLRWGGRRCDCAICLDCDMDDETRKICESVCKEYGFERLISKNELCEEFIGI